MARDRLRLWRPLTSRADSPPDQALVTISNDDVDRILAVINVSWAAGTRDCYGAGLLVYHVFCDSCNFSEAQRCPATPLSIVTFIASCAGSYAGSTLASYIFGVRAWHILHGLPWIMDDAQVNAALTGTANLAPPSSRRPKRAPFTVALIGKILAKLTLSTPLDAAVAAALTTIFFSVARTGEFTVPSVERFDPAIHVKRCDIRPEEDRHGLQVTVFALLRTKRATTGEDVYRASQLGPEDPQAALLNHFLVNNPAPLAHLFAYCHPKGARPLTRCAFLDRINAVALTLGTDHLKGHGIRIGATLEYLLRGVPFDIVKLMGRWGSKAFVLYLRKHAVIMAPYMQNHLLLDPFTRYTLPPLRRR